MREPKLDGLDGGLLGLVDEALKKRDEIVRQVSLQIQQTQRLTPRCELSEPTARAGWSARSLGAGGRARAASDRELGQGRSGARRGTDGLGGGALGPDLLLERDLGPLLGLDPLGLLEGGADGSGSNLRELVLQRAT